MRLETIVLLVIAAVYAAVSFSLGLLVGALWIG